MIDCIATFDVGSEGKAKSIIESIKPDMVFDEKSERSDVKLSRVGASIKLKVNSKDIPAFRSAINTYSKLIQVSGGLMKDG
jgi:tRNA threonylcarbamoyladenosine modification (KEOPS) complex  Pcc1 subunit